MTLGLGAHLRPIPLGIPGLLFALNLSWAQYFGIGLVVLAAIAFVTLAAFLIWTIPVSVSRLVNTYHPGRTSQSLGFEVALLILAAIAAFSGTIQVPTTLLLIALIFSVMSGANPLEEFCKQEDGFKRQMPKFAFGTPIHKWIDFWATNDLVSEYGLGDVHYRTQPGAEFAHQPISRRVTNMKSFAVDHTTYRQNLEQFIAPLTRLFLEELGFRKHDSTSGEDHGAIKTFLGYTPVYGNYEQDVSNSARSRANRVRLLGWASGLLLLTALLFSPGVYRSIGEYIVYDEPNPVSLSSTGEQIDAPGWFTTFYNPEPKT